MSLISQRPHSWNEIIGQERAVTVIQCMLKKNRFMTRGFIYKGVYGVGKTTTAYVTARALMCTGHDPVGCGKCLSCKTIEQYGIEGHTDFLEIDAAVNPGVEFARKLVEDTKMSPIMGKRRVIIIDEAHRLSREAWDAYLKILEEPTESADSKYPLYFFVTNDATKIPDTIQSRCTSINFQKVPTDAIVGLLSNVCNLNKIKYELDGLKVIAKMAKGHVRFATNYLGTVASITDLVTKQIASDVLDDTLEDQCLKMFLAIITKNPMEASRLSDEACRSFLPNQVIDGMFSMYARALFAPENSQMAKILAALPNVPAISATFLRWTNTQYLTSDVLPLLVVELMDTLGINPQPNGFVSNAPSIIGRILPADEIFEILGAVEYHIPK